MEEFNKKAINYFIIGLIAEKLDMRSEAATNFFKSLFAIDDSALFRTISKKPKDHTERFRLLEENLPELYVITDRLFSTYGRTYTQELSKEELRLVKKRIMEAFANAKISAPTDSEIEEKFKELLKKGKIFG